MGRFATNRALAAADWPARRRRFVQRVHSPGEGYCLALNWMERNRWIGSDVINEEMEIPLHGREKDL
jgi:hypothetical protein